MQNPLQFLMADGAVHVISTFAVPETLKALITRDGGEGVGGF